MPYFKQIKRSVTMFSIQNLEACSFENVYGVHADEEVIIHNECIWGVRNRRVHQMLR